MQKESTQDTITQKTKTLWVGGLSFVNALPYFYPLLNEKVKTPFSYTLGNPSDVNKMLLQEDVDIGLISSLFYLQNKEKLHPSFSWGIGAKEKVQSVMLFSHCRVTELSGKTVLLPRSSETSIGLLRVLSFHFWKISPIFSFDETKAFDAKLLIGDACLKEPKKQMSYDLATSWYEATQLPFIFALFASREEVCNTFIDAIEKSYSWSKNNMQTIVQAAEKKVPQVDFMKYFTTLQYQLEKSHKDGMQLFYKLFKEVKDSYDDK